MKKSSPVGERGSHIKKTGVLVGKERSERYQDPVLWAWFDVRRTNYKTTHQLSLIFNGNKDDCFEHLLLEKLILKYLLKDIFSA